MVRTLALIFIISFLAGCTGSEAPPPESPSVSAPLGATLVIPGKGLDALSDWAERALGERLPESTLVPFEGDDTLSGGGIQWGSAFATSFENTLIDLGFPQDNGAIPVEIELPFLELPYTTVDPEGNPCEGLLRFPSPRLAFELKGSLTRSGTTAFAALGSTLTTGTPEWVDCPPDEEIWSEPVLAVLDTDLAPTLAAQSRETLVEALALRVAGKTGGSAKTATNTPVRWVLGLEEQSDETSLNSRGTWLHFDLNGFGASDAHPCSPNIQWNETSDQPEPLTAGEIAVQAATDNSFDSDPFSYGLVVSRQLIEQWFVHATHAGAFCSRSAAIPTDIDTLLRDELPGEMPPGDGDELTLHVQPLIAPRVFLDTTNNLFVFRVFFERIRADLNRTMDGIDIRLVSIEGPVSVSVHPRLEKGLTLKLMVTEVDSLPLSQSDAISARSPFWDKAELPENLPKRLLQTYFESVSEAVPPLPIEEPSPLPLIPLFPYQAGQNHVVFPFTFETSEIPSD